MKRFASLLIGLNLAIASSLTAQVKEDVKALQTAYTIQDLVTLSDSGGVLLPLQINGIDTNLIMHTSYKGVVVDTRFAEQAKISGIPTSQRPDQDLSLAKDAKLKSGRIDMIRSGTGKALRIHRGKTCIVADTTLPAGARFKGKELPIGGMAGLETIENVRPVIDFGKGRLLIPFKSTRAGRFSEIMLQEKFEPVFMAREGNDGPFYVIIKIKRKNYAFLVDLNQRGSSVDTLISKQLALEVADNTTTLTKGMIGSTSIEDFKFKVTDLDRAGRNIIGNRLAGKVGTDFFKKYKVALDFAGRIAAIPFANPAN